MCFGLMEGCRNRVYQGGPPLEKHTVHTGNFFGTSIPTWIHVIMTMSTYEFV